MWEAENVRGKEKLSFTDSLLLSVGSFPEYSFQIFRRTWAEKGKDEHSQRWLSRRVKLGADVRGGKRHQLYSPKGSV